MLTILDHPVSRHYLTLLRDKETTPEAFRRYADQVTTFLAVEATRELRERSAFIETPLESIDAPYLDERVTVVAILRAGISMVEAFTRLLPEVQVGFVGMERNEETAEAHDYYHKFPDFGDGPIYLVDPMLATGGSAIGAIEFLLRKGAEPAQLRMICQVAAPEGIAALHARWPELPILTAARDRELNERKYICPGLGDFGDRLFGT